MIPCFVVYKTDLLTGRKFRVFRSFNDLGRCLDFVKSRVDLMKLYGFVYDYKIYLL